MCDHRSNGCVRSHSHPATIFLGAGLALGTLLFAALGLTCNEYDPTLLHYASERNDSGASSHPDADDAADGHDSHPDVLADEAADGHSHSDALADTVADINEEGHVDGPVSDSAVSFEDCYPCEEPALARPPCRPIMNDLPSLAETFVFAMRTVHFGMSSSTSTSWKSLGQDLDCLVTAPSGEPSMCKRVSSDPTVLEDGDNGRDNSFARNIGNAVRLLSVFGLIEKDIEDELNKDLTEGDSGLTWSISDFNGSANDPQVTFAMYMSRGTYNADGSDEVPARWDGTDLWSVRADLVTPEGQSLYSDDAAYVSNHVLVAHLPDGLPLVFQSAEGAIHLSLNETRLALTLSQDLQAVTEGSLAGAWSSVMAIAAFDDFAANLGICSDNPQYATVREVVASAADIRLDLQPAPGLNCNAFSTGMSLTGARAKLGALIEPPTPHPNMCEDAGANENLR